jgi:SMC interacting uncharacterized protein involved in chromosome segregation
MAGAEWYEAMASAMKKREKCLNGIARWQADLVEAEAEIQALRDGDTAEVEAVDDPDVRLTTAVTDWKVQQEQAAAVIDPNL